MITLAPLTDKEKIRAAWEENGLTYSDISGCVTERCGDEVLGYCLYTLDSEKMVILRLVTTDDAAFADGLLRSTLHVAAERSVLNAFYDGEETERLCKKLGFILNRDKGLIQTSFSKAAAANKKGIFLLCVTDFYVSPVVFRKQSR